MKPKLQLPVIIILAMLLGACATILPGNDPVLVNAERTTSVAYTTFDSFFALERQQEVYVKANLPEVHKFANSLRANAPRYLAIARATTEAYRLNRDENNKATLNTAIAILQTAISQVQVYTSQITSKETP